MRTPFLFIFWYTGESFGMYFLYSLTPEILYNTGALPRIVCFPAALICLHFHLCQPLPALNMHEIAFSFVSSNYFLFLCHKRLAFNFDLFPPPFVPLPALNMHEIAFSDCPSLFLFQFLSSPSFFSSNFFLLCHKKIAFNFDLFPPPFVSEPALKMHKIAFACWSLFRISFPLLFNPRTRSVHFNYFWHFFKNKRCWIVLTLIRLCQLLCLTTIRYLNYFSVTLSSHFLLTRLLVSLNGLPPEVVIHPISSTYIALLHYFAVTLSCNFLGCQGCWFHQSLIKWSLTPNGDDPYHPTSSTYITTVLHPSADGFHRKLQSTKNRY